VIETLRPGQPDQVVQEMLERHADRLAVEVLPPTSPHRLIGAGGRGRAGAAIAASMRNLREADARIRTGDPFITRSHCFYCHRI
jgi:hypothetical protein